jgi:Sperm-tail PG-rich repeat
MNKSNNHNASSQLVARLDPAKGHVSSSIPTKHSVIIKPVIRSKGFGKSAERFECQDAVERMAHPGPGRYNPSSQNPWGSSAGGKMQPKNIRSPGLGSIPFLSSYTGVAVKGGPGPGAYNISSIFNEHSGSTAGEKKSKKSSTFGMSVRSNSLHTLHKSEMDAMRGPGEYSTASPPLRSNPGISMKSRSKRLELPNSETNHLDFYDVGKNMLMQKHYIEPQFSSAFAKPYKMSLRKVRLNELEKIKKVIEIAPGTKNAPDLWANVSQLGPGQYNHQKSYLFLKEYTHEKNKIDLVMPGFRSKIPRIPNPKPEKKPEPATYNIPSTFDYEKFQVKSPAFMSESLRGSLEHQDDNYDYSAMPYDLTMKPRQMSFHKNPKQVKAIWH